MDIMKEIDIGQDIENLRQDLLDMVGGILDFNSIVTLL